MLANLAQSFMRQPAKSLKPSSISLKRAACGACCQLTNYCAKAGLAGNPHDLFEIGQVFGQLADLLQEAGLEVEGLFLMQTLALT